MNKYYKEFIVKNSDAFNDGYMKVDKILGWMAEVSTYHSNALGLSVDEIRKNDYGWMLIKWELEIIKYPQVNDTINVSTWTSGFNKFYANREFEILDDSGILIAKASSLWVFLNISKRRPIRIPFEITKKYSVVEQKNFGHFTKIEIEGDLLIKSGEFKVVEDDLDENNHVNNIKYIEWLFLGLGEKQKEYRIRKLAINYKNELLLDNNLHTQVIQSKEENKLYHKIQSGEKINAEALTLWGKKETSL